MDQPPPPCPPPPASRGCSTCNKQSELQVILRIHQLFLEQSPNLLVPDCRCSRLKGADTLVRVNVSSPGLAIAGPTEPAFTSLWERMVIGADLSERMSQKPEPTPCRDFKEPQLEGKILLAWIDSVSIGWNVHKLRVWNHNLKSAY